ncbi:hypothetical protein GGF46_001775 [Coemansia sp. RSA 552]|nr:hypothetical protein GGF46_001775 [Coemansia sp. RSA 552]
MPQSTFWKRSSKPAGPQQPPPPPPPQPKQRRLFRRALALPWRYKKTLLFAAGTLYLGNKYLAMKSKNYATQNIVDGTALVWRITDNSITEVPDEEPFGGWPTFFARRLAPNLLGKNKITMLDALVALEMAAEDPRVKKLIVEVGHSPIHGGNSISTGLGIAQTQELRQALARFQEKKKEQHGPDASSSYFFIDSFDDQLTYYFASAFSNIAVQPTGHIPLTGVGTTQVYFKDLIERVGIHLHTETRRGYKDVLTPFTHTTMPEKQRENMMSILDSLNSTVIADIAKSRAADISTHALQNADAGPVTAADVVRKAMEQGPLSARGAEHLGLITARDYLLDADNRIGYLKPIPISTYLSTRTNENVNEFVKMLEGIRSITWRSLIKDDAGQTHPVAKFTASYLPMMTVGIVYLTGGIERQGSNCASNISSMLLKAAKDKTVDAIVLRIDSGGGDVVASETIGATVDYVQAEFGKPVVASYGNVSASGAYYASASCKRIFASPSTLTGSIGVASMSPTVTRKLLDHVSINVEELRTIDNKRSSVLEPPQGVELERYQQMVDDIYTDFTQRVATNRGYSSEDVEKVAQGRLFTGTQALVNGLVDEVGSLTRAIEAAAQLGNEVWAENTVRSLKRSAEQGRKETIHKFVELGKVDSIETAQKLTAPYDIQDLPLDNLKKELKSIEGEYTADVTKNIRIKPFVHRETSLMHIARSFFDPSSAAEAGTMDISAAIWKAVRGAVSAAIQDEVTSLLSQDPDRLLAQVAERQKRQQHSVRAEADTKDFK